MAEQYAQTAEEQCADGRQNQPKISDRCAKIVQAKWHSKKCYFHQPINEPIKADKMADDKAKCRGCDRELRGNPYWTGKPAYFPLDEGGGRVPSCFYGGWVCSERCDRKACLELEQSMPGHGITQRSVSHEVGKKISETWDNFAR